MTSRREVEARRVAEKYAPKPDASSMLYGAMAVVLLAMGLSLFGMFYQIDMYTQPVLLATAAGAAFAAGVVLRKLRKRRHSRAVVVEYERSGTDH
jgi:predicted PurR-regulated permease PerM